MTHFPYRKYVYNLVIRRKRSYRWRMNHDAWCWVLVLVMIAVFVVLEWVR
jgi:hypothetical protein